MSVIDLCRLLRRRWLVLGTCLVAAVLVSVVGSRGQTVYWSNTDVRLVPPAQSTQANPLLTTTDSVIATAGLVVEEVNAASHTPRLSSDQVTIVDAGITDGVLVRLPNAGGQWATNFNQPMINVQVSGSGPEEVRAQTAAMVHQVLATLEQRQSAAGVATTDRISAYATPALPVVATAHGSRTKALAAMLALGLGLSLGLTMYVDQILLRRRAARARRAPDTRELAHT